MVDKSQDAPTDGDVIARFNAMVTADKEAWCQRFKDFKSDIMVAAKTPLYASGLPAPLAQTLSYFDQVIQQLGG